MFSFPLAGHQEVHNLKIEKRIYWYKSRKTWITFIYPNTPNHKFFWTQHK